MENEEGYEGFFETLVPLLGRTDVPMKAVAAIGEIITVDAHLRKYGGGLEKANSFEERL
jgi:hypothetical protein